MDSRIVWKNGKMELDGCLIQSKKDTDYLKKLNQVVGKMALTAILGMAVSIALVLVRRWTHIPKRCPNFFLVSQILAGVGAFFPSIRLRQVYSEFGGILYDNAHHILKDRLAIYAACEEGKVEFPDIKKPCLHPSEIKPLHSLWVSQWAQKLLNQEPKTLEERKNWFKKFLEEKAPLNGSSAESLSKLSLIPLENPFSALIKNYENYQYNSPLNENGIYENYKPVYVLKMNSNISKLNLWLQEQYPQINEAFSECCLPLKGSDSQEQIRIFEEYRDLAYITALANNPDISQFLKQHRKNLQLLADPHAIDCLIAHQFLTQIIEFLKSPEKKVLDFQSNLNEIIKCPELTNLPEKVPPLEASFINQASDLSPLIGDTASYQEFLKKIKFS